MAMSMLPGTNQTVSRYTDVRDEPVTSLLAPIKGYQDTPLVSLETALEPVSHFFDEILANAWVAKENCQQPKEGLTQDESASIHLYTMQFDGGPSLFYVLNQTLRAENRQNLQPWFPFLKLFLTALYKLPSRALTVWRGVRGVDLSSKYPKGKKVAWWGVSSCTTNVEVLNNNQFLGHTGIRTIFSIECQNGKAVTRHSYFKDIEEEVILMPGSYFEVIGLLSPTSDLHIIQLKEINALFPLVKPPFDKTGPLIPAAQATSSQMVSTPTTLSTESPPVSVVSPQAKPTHFSPVAKSASPAHNSHVPKAEVQAVSQTTADVPVTNNLNVPYTSPNGEFKVIKCDMSLYLQERIISIIIPAIKAGGQDTSIAKRIKLAVDEKHRPSWHCVVGNNIGSYVTHTHGYFLYFQYGQKTVLLWKFDK